MSTRNGKIARLSWDLREELNGRLHEGQTGRIVLEWLNEEPEVKEMVARDFEGVPVSEQNLSEWRQGGYGEWEERRYLFEDAQESWAQGDDLKRCNEGMVDRLVHVLGARYAQLLLHWDGEATEGMERKVKLLCRLSRNVLALQRGTQREARLEMAQVVHGQAVEEVERKKASWARINAAWRGTPEAAVEETEVRRPKNRKTEGQKGVKSKGIKPNQTKSKFSVSSVQCSEKTGELAARQKGELALTPARTHSLPLARPSGPLASSVGQIPFAASQAAQVSPEERGNRPLVVSDGEAKVEGTAGDSRAGRPRSVQNAAESEGIKLNQTESECSVSSVQFSEKTGGGTPPEPAAPNTSGQVEDARATLNGDGKAKAGDSAPAPVSDWGSNGGRAKWN